MESRSSVVGVICAVSSHSSFRSLREHLLDNETTLHLNPLMNQLLIGIVFYVVFGWLGTCHIDQAGLRVIHLPLPLPLPVCWN